MESSVVFEELKKDVSMMNNVVVFTIITAMNQKTIFIYVMQAITMKTTAMVIVFMKKPVIYPMLIYSYFVA